MDKMPVLVDKSNVKAFLDSFDAFMTDCDGVLWTGNDVINNANLVVNKLIAMGKKVFFITNNSSKSRKQYAEKCATLNFNVSEENIVGSSYAVAQYFKSIGFNKKVYAIGSEGLAQELDEAGIQHIGIGPDPLMGCSVTELPKAVTLDPDVGAVIVAFDIHFCIAKMLRAASYLGSVPNCAFVASNTDENLPFRGTNITFPGTGCLVRSVETAVNRKATVMGKPESHIFEIIQKKHGIVPQRTIMVGDRCNTDILLGTRCGLHTMLVLTGVHQLEDVQAMIDSGDPDQLKNVPQYYLPSLGHLLELLD